MAQIKRGDTFVLHLAGALAGMNSSAWVSADVRPNSGTHSGTYSQVAAWAQAGFNQTVNDCAALGPTEEGGVYEPYKCFRRWRKPWGRRNWLSTSIKITHGYQKERHASQHVFLTWNIATL